MGGLNNLLLKGEVGELEGAATTKIDLQRGLSSRRVGSVLEVK